LDVPSFIDFFLMNELSRNVDGLRISTYFHKNEDAIDPRLHAGPVWDFNLSLGNADYCNGQLTEGWAYEFNKVCPKDYWIIPFWWERLREDSLFKAETAKRWRTLRQTTLSDKSIETLIQDLKAQLDQGAAQRNFEQWNILGKRVWPNYYIGKTWEEEVDYLQKWVLARAAWLDKSL
jgi:CotH kinase protein